METNNHGENPASVSPASNVPPVLTATETLRRYVLGEYKGKLPLCNWNVDGNIFSVIGTLRRAWKHVDRKVYERTEFLTTFAMSGEIPTRFGFPSGFSAELRKEMEGYDELLAFCLNLTEVDHDGDDDEELADDFPDEEDSDE